MIRDEEEKTPLAELPTAHVIAPGVVVLFGIAVAVWWAWGLLQATVLSTRNANYGIGRAIAPDTSVIAQVERKGHPHCYCDAATLVGLLAGFDLLTLSQQIQERRSGSHHWHILPNVAAESGFRRKSTIRKCDP